jgi:tRNA(fMet)-specific endonuclease VapC
MIERLAVDTNAAIEWLSPHLPDPAPLRDVDVIVLPLPVLGELYTGAFASQRRAQNVPAIDALVGKHEILLPDAGTANAYGRIRARLQLSDIRASKMNDLWIAALCLQHSLPLLTNDRGFDSIEGLAVVHW